MNNNKEYKIAVIGDSGVGKTSMIQFLISNEYLTNTKPTIGAAYHKMSFNSPDGVEIPVNIWDTAGQERFQSLIPLYLRNVHGVLLVFDSASQIGQNNLEKAYTELMNNLNSEVPLLLCGNKNDLLSDPDSIAYIEDWASNRKIDLMFTSAKTGHNINAAFQKIAEMAYIAEKDKVDDDTIASQIVSSSARPKKSCC